ncbi:hypothetical protein GUJ93_ZPchr0006g44679 [Zizania palustris]|uniref:Uncharacterized protein n=1 Tax=Zizania palustris TaxID=103762 RepID=A0A8J5S9G5_ZIZPA|nr:hypothetical protein GUJ93_ZPchr0006g44679 [Zizania palustris]
MQWRRLKIYRLSCRKEKSARKGRRGIVIGVAGVILRGAQLCLGVVRVRLGLPRQEEAHTGAQRRRDSTVDVGRGL